MRFVDCDPPTISQETDLLTIAQTFLDASCRRLPVLDHEGRLLGQLSRRDLLLAAQSEVGHESSIPLNSGSASLYISAIFEAGERPI
jgi:CBS-domain-containing membrane protein